MDNSRKMMSLKDDLGLEHPSTVKSPWARRSRKVSTDVLAMTVTALIGVIVGMFLITALKACDEPVPAATKSAKPEASRGKP